MNVSKKQGAFIVAVVAAIAILAPMYYFFVATDQVTGRVDHKSINGTMDGTSYTLVNFIPHGAYFNPLISDLSPEDPTNTTVAQWEDIEAALEQRGFELRYIANIQVPSHDSVNGLSAGMASGYFVNQGDFNQLSLNDLVTYEVPHDEKNVIARFDVINNIPA